MKIDLFDYHLPKELIAQTPISPRDHSRLLVLEKESGKIEDKHFYDLPDFLNADDVLVLNETKVFPARLRGKKKTGGRVEVFLTHKINKHTWECLIGGRALKINDKIYFASLAESRREVDLQGEIIKDIDGKTKQVKFNLADEDFLQLVEKIGHTPLPPYIKTEDSRQIKKDYQTVFAKDKGSVAAPTAGLHFTPELLEKIKAKGVEILTVTLHVGLGTFAPVEVDEIEEHQIHSEWASISKYTVEKLNELKQQGKNIVAVGTTAARLLEAFTNDQKNLVAGEKWVDIYIYPGYEYKFIDALVTNFHLPKSSLLFMVSALVGRENVLAAYKHAIAEKYRFFSFGDAMFITQKIKQKKKDPA
ncbi:tRNA preQ1(34) S-adenosylmethionine ribosyltransferase-isomerase QueA [bacterium]|jgi:S-adenosylmethionine:tRNA ribosyltransferase-isomerase|nr:tRNA preQ1(34) S-adenosylmethionine ribosyltransferase-isomerase QueA [bacterium]